MSNRIVKYFLLMAISMVWLCLVAAKGKKIIFGGNCCDEEPCCEDEVEEVEEVHEVEEEWW